MYKATGNENKNLFNNFFTSLKASGFCLSWKGIQLDLLIGTLEVINRPINKRPEIQSIIFHLVDLFLSVPFSSVFSPTRSQHDLSSFVPSGYRLHPGFDQQEVAEYSHQPFLPCSSTNIHLFFLLETPEMWRQKNWNCILSHTNCGEHITWNFTLAILLYFPLDPLLCFIRHNDALVPQN